MKFNPCSVVKRPDRQDGPADRQCKIYKIIPLKNTPGKF